MSFMRFFDTMAGAFFIFIGICSVELGIYTWFSGFFFNPIDFMNGISIFSSVIYFVVGILIITLGSKVVLAVEESR